MGRKPRVFNKRMGDAPASAVYVGRPSPWGNVFTHLPEVAKRPGMVLVPTREEAVSRYEPWLMAQPELVERARRELAGKDLVCWCAPEPCHADVLLRVANTRQGPRQVARPRGEAPARIDPSLNDGRTIFVFGSNLGGRHGLGAAREAHLHWGAQYGVGQGRTGMAYAIPTKDARLRVLEVGETARHVRAFLRYAEENPGLRFLVTRVGCGLASEGRGAEREAEMMRLFVTAPSNVWLPPGWCRKVTRPSQR